MILTSWPQGVNTNFFSMSVTPKENTIEQTYTSGRAIVWQKNTKKIKSINVKIALKVGTELDAFFNWYDETLAQTAGAFSCSALGSGYYRFTNPPSAEDTDQLIRILNLSIEEFI